MMPSCLAILETIFSPVMPQDMRNYTKKTELKNADQGSIDGDGLSEQRQITQVSRTCAESSKIISLIAFTTLAGVALLTVGILGQSGALAKLTSQATIVKPF